MRSSGGNNEKPHILFVSPVGELGGAEQVALSYARLLPQKNYQVSLALLRPGKLEHIAREQGIEVHVFPKEYRFRDLASVVRSVLWLCALVKSQKVDLLHANHASHFIANLAARLSRIKQIWHLYDYPYEWDPIDQVNRRFSADFNIYMTEKTRSGYVNQAKIPSAIISPDCVDVKAIQQIPKDRSTRTRYDLGAAPYFLTVARLQEHKGHSYLIDAAKQVATHRSDVLWLIVGKASGIEQDRYLSTLLEQVRKQGLEQRVRFLGFVDDNNLASLRQEALALVHPATSEGYGLVLIEAMAAGTPVIAAAADGPKEIIQDRNNGLLVPVRDPMALGAAMICLLENETLRQTLIAGGYQYSETHNAETMLENTCRVYERLLASPITSAPA